MSAGARGALRTRLAYALKCAAVGPQMGVDWSLASNRRWLEQADAVLADVDAYADAAVAEAVAAVWDEVDRQIEAELWCPRTLLRSPLDNLRARLAECRRQGAALATVRRPPTPEDSHA